ncbi:hypothetical protein LIER_42073 [Lithospermum erythrorhizon]|uniref:Uncharacterized protein n=1 Tax=Lithospermum erythrorhizon TaxID=34254 RepID=A0AAV3RJ32_LITER
MISSATSTLLLLLSLTIAAVDSRGVLKLPSEALRFLEAEEGGDDGVGVRWAVLIAGSNGYWNYRHQVLI